LEAFWKAFWSTFGGVLVLPEAVLMCFGVFWGVLESFGALWGTFDSPGMTIIYIKFNWVSFV